MFFPGLQDQVYIATGATDIAQVDQWSFHYGCRATGTQPLVGAPVLFLQPEAGYC